jgi:hypothetical protein
MTQAKMSSPLFDLPLELREDVYKSVLYTSDPSILQTCREVCAEARKFLYQRPLSFQSQAALHTWLGQNPQELLNHVFDITLHIQEVDLKPILNLRTISPQHRSQPRLSTLKLYQLEINRIQQALSRIPNVKTITIRTLLGRPSYLYREFVDQILTILSTLHPSLRDLRLEGNFHHHELGFLSNLQNLEYFSFDGFSSSSPAATANILASLPNLVGLSLISEHSLPTINDASHHRFAGKRQSFTGDVACRLGKLASFSVAERVPTSTPSLFFTPDVLASLHNHQTLKDLSIHLSQAPNTAILEFLESFLEGTPIERLELDWPGLDPFVLERYLLLNESLRVVWARASSEADAFEILWSLVERRAAGELCELKRVVLIRSLEISHESHNASPSCSERKDSGLGQADLGYYSVSPFSLAFTYDSMYCCLQHLQTKHQFTHKLSQNSPNADDQDASNITRAKRRLNNLGVQFAWSTESV